MPSTVEANATATAVNAAIQIATTTTRRHRRSGAPNSGRERLRIGGQPIYPRGRRHRQQWGTFGRWNASHRHGYHPGTEGACSEARPACRDRLSVASRNRFRSHHGCPERRAGSAWRHLLRRVLAMHSHLRLRSRSGWRLE
jgi:hypothetical protein